MDAAVRKRLEGGQYDAITSAAELSEVLTAHLREGNGDEALRVVYSAAAKTGEPAHRERERFHENGALENFCFARVERLPGNVGYLKLDRFFPAEAPGAGETALFAMGFLANTSVLIIDLRENGGGR